MQNLDSVSVKLVMKVLGDKRISLSIELYLKRFNKYLPQRALDFKHLLRFFIRGDRQKCSILGISRPKTVELLKTPCIVGLKPRKLHIFSSI